MNKKAIIAAIVAVALIIGGVYWWQHRQTDNPNQLVLNGNVDVRQVSLSFNGNGRIASLAVHEGDTVSQGQVLGQLDTNSLKLQAKELDAQIAVQKAQANNLRSGARPQEIAQAQSKVAAAKAQAVHAQNELSRLQAVTNETAGKATSAQELDAARAQAKSAQAQLDEARDGLKLLQAGARREEINAADAQVKAIEAKQDLLNYQISQAELTAPVSGVVRSRLLEPGDMASPQTPVYTLALTEPKWVRVYVNETDLGKIYEGMNAKVTTDSEPNQSIDGVVGYIASVAEFTPKSVETTELRTSLVYEVRVRIQDKANRLRLGQPATVTINLAAKGRQNQQ